MKNKTGMGQHAPSPHPTPELHIQPYQERTINHRWLELNFPASSIFLSLHAY